MIHYHCQGTDFGPKFKTKINSWIKTITQNLGYHRLTLNYIFCSDDELLEINKQFLGHDYYTDIITFDTIDDQRIKKNSLSGDIFISVDTVMANSDYYNVRFEDELLRVMIHGVLHLAGFDDHTDSESAEMRRQENAALSCWYERFV